jgi:hypothetical protein
MPRTGGATGRDSMYLAQTALLVAGRLSQLTERLGYAR